MARGGNGRSEGRTANRQYALVNLLYYPIKNVTMGIEGQWGHRDNHSDDFSSDDWRIQLGFKYNFSHTWEVSP